MQTIWSKIAQHKGRSLLMLVLALCLVGGLMYYYKSKIPVAAVSTISVSRGDIKAEVAATGTISAVNSVDISSRVTGLITEVKVKENDRVEQGQVLVVLDDTTLKSQVAQYKAQLANYEAIYERTRKLAAVGAVAQQQLDTDRTSYLVAKSNYENYVSQQSYYVITAPIDGVVVGKPTPAGQTVAQGISSPQVIMTIADLSKMQIKVMVDETDIGKVREGQAVTFTVDAYSGKTFTGKVTTISRSATTTSNVIYYPVYVEVDSAEGLLFPSMTARVNICIGESQSALVIPLSAIKEDKGEKYVQVMVNGQMQNVAVTLGLSDDEKVEILSGLNETDQIVLPAAKAKTTKTEKNPGPPPL